MALTVALYTGNRPVGGVATPWDEVLEALSGSEEALRLIGGLHP